MKFEHTQIRIANACMKCSGYMDMPHYCSSGYDEADDFYVQ